MRLARLPEMPELARQYVQPGASYKTLAARYGCSASTVRNRLKAWAAETGKSWPLKPDAETRGQNRDVVSADLVRNEVAAACKRYRISQVTLARLAGLDDNHLHKITSGHVEKIQRKTQGMLLEVISQIEAGEIVVPPEPVILPTQVRTHCPNNHPYTGKRNPKTGRRMCSVCNAGKQRRRIA